MPNKKRKSEDGDVDHSPMNAMVIPQEMIDKALQMNESQIFDDDQTQIFSIEDLRNQHRIQLEEAFRERRNSESKEYNEVQRETDVIYIPDIHGDLTALRNSLTNLGVINEHDEWVGGKSVVVFSGDYIDRGEQNIAVLDFVWKLKEEAGFSGGKVELLLGNHEAAMIGGLLGDNQLLFTWLCQGGINVVIEAAEKISRQKGYEEYFSYAHSLLNDLKSQKLLSGQIKIFRQYNLNEEVFNHILEHLRYWIFDENGKFYDLFNSMKVFTQVDDVLYVHAGVNLDWSRRIKSKGVDGLNSDWSSAYVNAKNGDQSSFKIFNQAGSSRGGGNTSITGGPFWADFDGELEKLPEKDIAQIAQNLKSIGVNAIVVGHTIKKTPTMSEKFNKYGIKLIFFFISFIKFCPTKILGLIVINK